MKYAPFDIETVPSQSLPEGLKPEFDPADIKVGAMGPEKAQEKIDKERTKFNEGLDKKMSLDPDLCEVVCFVGKSRGITIAPTNDIVKNAWKYITSCYLGHIPLVSFNGIQFDLPVLWHSAMKLNIPVSPIMYDDLTKKYSKGFTYHYDLMQLLANWDKTKYKKLDFYLKLFGIGAKTGDGSQVYQMWKNKEYDKIREYCEEDVNLTAKLFEKLAAYFVKEQ